jgi:hypothetical protein
MDRLGKSLSENKKVRKKDPHLHSINHLLADELSKKLRDTKHFGFYLKMAILYDHNFLRKLSSEVLEGKSVRSPGKLFAFLIKEHNKNLKDS